MWEINAEVSPSRAELLDDFLAESGAEGWHIYAEAYGGLVRLTGYFEDEASARLAWENLRADLPIEIELGEPAFRPVEDRDWRDAYKAHFHRWRFEGLHWAPVWEKGEFYPPEGEQVVWLDPGMAFGTGNHETTRLCVERIVECRREWEAEGRDLAETRVIDAGCGSGILAVSAAKCGFGKVAGFDSDPVAVEVSEENAELNELAGRIDFYQGDLVSGLQGRVADLLLANIQADVLCGFAAELASAVAPGGRLVLSGILVKELPEVEARFKETMPDADFSSRELGEWADLLAKL